MSTWPVGLRFVPTEEELVDHYLRRKLEGELEAFCLIPELYIYKCEPPDLFVRYNELSDIPSDGRECFFFCPPGDKIPNNRRSNNRMTEFGYWKDTCKERAIRSLVTGEQIGIRKIFVYYEGRQRKGCKTDVVMHQYHLNSEVSASKVSGPMAFVLCHIIDRKLKKASSAKASTLASLSTGSTTRNDLGNGMVTWPVGLRFEPTEEELVDHHLKGKLKGKLEAFCLIPELYIYVCEPPDLFIRYNELSDIPSDGRECFFFCPPGDQIPKNCRSNNRMTKFGYWKDTCKERKIRSPVSDKQIGIRKIFVYYEGRQPKGRKTDIVMHQYHLNSEVSASKVSGPMAFVLCHIIKRKPKKARAKASTSASSSIGSSPTDFGNGRAHEISAQASEEVVIQTENLNEMSISSMPDSNAPSIPQQAQMQDERSSLYNGYPSVDGHSDECYAMPYSPSDYIEILDLWNVG